MIFKSGEEKFRRRWRKRRFWRVEWRKCGRRCCIIIQQRPRVRAFLFFNHFFSTTRPISLIPFNLTLLHLKSIEKRSSGYFKCQQQILSDNLKCGSPNTSINKHAVIKYVDDDMSHIRQGLKKIQKVNWSWQVSDLFKPPTTNKGSPNRSLCLQNCLKQPVAVSH